MTRTLCVRRVVVRYVLLILFCKECENWSADFRKLYLRHKNSLLAKRVSKKNRKEGKSKDISPLNVDVPPPQVDEPPPPPP